MQISIPSEVVSHQSERGGKPRTVMPTHILVMSVFRLQGFLSGSDTVKRRATVALWTRWPSWAYTGVPVLWLTVWA